MAQIHPARLTTDALETQLPQLEKRDYVQMEQPEPQEIYRFKHNVTQEVTYETLLYAQRREMHRAIAGRDHDLVLTGAISADVGGGHVGGMLAAMLGIAHVSLATGLSLDGTTAVVRHEAEGGLERVVEVDLPALVTVQTGINEPRYVSIRGIRRVAGREIPILGAADLGLDPETVGAAGAPLPFP